MCVFTPEEINSMMVQVFRGMLREIKQENNNGQEQQ
jgi:hypothetical protein